MIVAADVVQLKPMIIICTLLALLILERIFPVATWKGGINRLGRNFGLSGFNAILSPLIILPIAQLADTSSLNWRPDYLGAAWMIFIDLVILDFWIYWWHRVNHVVPALWRFHEVHHLDDTLDATSALRFHFGEVFLSSIIRAGLIIVLDIPFLSVVVFEIVVGVMALFHHSNVRLPAWLENPLALIIVTPKLHWVHHHALRADTDSNYASVLSFWDRIFGSASLTERKADMVIGVERARDRNFIELLLRPFRW